MITDINYIIFYIITFQEKLQKSLMTSESSLDGSIFIQPPKVFKGFRTVLREDPKCQVGSDRQDSGGGIPK